MIESRITAKGQTTLPKVVREALGLQAGDRVRYILHNGEARIRPVASISRLFGVLKHDGPVVTLEEMGQAIAEGAAEGAFGSDRP